MLASTHMATKVRTSSRSKWQPRITRVTSRAPDSPRKSPPENSGSCPDAEQYYGKIVNGVERMIVIGALRFPEDRAITSVEAAAKKAASSGVFSLDSILFGRWRD